MRAGYFFTDFPSVSKEYGLKQLKCTSFILIDEEYGPMIFDTGSFYNYTPLLEYIKNEFGLYPDDIKWVFISHIHPDHIGANRFFKKAKLIFSRKDYEFSAKIADVVFSGGDLLSYLHTNCPGYKNSFTQFESDNMGKAIKDAWSEENIGLTLNPAYIENDPEIPPFIKIIPTFGHTFFHHSYIINKGDFNILAAGDALSMRMILREEKKERLDEPHMDFEQYFKTLNEIKNFEGLIVPGHDRPFFPKNLKAVRKNKFLLRELVTKS